jgi:hypothetical protein
MSRQHASRQGVATPAFDNASGDISRRAAVVDASSNLKSYLPSTALKGEMSGTAASQDFSTVPALSASSDAFTKKMSVQDRGGSSSTSGTKGISGSGSGKVVTTYTPEAKDKSTKIVFIQVMRESLDGVASMPSALDKDFAYQDADTTSDFHHVDYVSGEKDAYYNGDDPQDSGVQGNAITGVAASVDDTPHYVDSNFPAGSSKMLYEFRTAAYSAAGADAGTYYGYSDWTYSKDKGLPEATATTGTGTGDPGSKFTDAVALFNGNHGGLSAGAIVGIVLGSIAGAALLGVGIAAAAGAFSG